MIAMRASHCPAGGLTLADYCERDHVVVSDGGDPHGFVDEALVAQGLARRVALTVPNFMLALSVVAETNLIAAVPRRFAEAQGARFGITAIDPPLSVGAFRLNAVALKSAMLDAGVAWLLALLERAAASALIPPTR